MRVNATSTVVAGLLVSGLLALGACSQAGSGGSEGQTGEGSPATASSGAASPAAARQSPAAAQPKPTASEKDVKIDACALKGGTVEVEATVKNAAARPQSYVVAVEVLQGGKKVDGVALFAGAVAAGKSAKVNQSGNATLKGAVTCKVTSVQAVAG